MEISFLCPTLAGFCETRALIRRCSNRLAICGEGGAGTDSSREQKNPKRESCLEMRHPTKFLAPAKISLLANAEPTTNTVRACLWLSYTSASRNLLIISSAVKHFWVINKIQRRTLAHAYYHPSPHPCQFASRTIDCRRVAIVDIGSCKNPCGVDAATQVCGFDNSRRSAGRWA